SFLLILRIANLLLRTTAGAFSALFPTKKTGTGGRSVREQGDLVAVDDLHPVAPVEHRLRRLVDRLGLAAVELHHPTPVALLLGLLLDLVAASGPPAPPRDSGTRLAAARADLVAQHASGNAADHHARARRLAFFLDIAHGGDDAAGGAGSRGRL